MFAIEKLCDKIEVVEYKGLPLFRPKEDNIAGQGQRCNSVMCDTLNKGGTRPQCFK